MIKNKVKTSVNEYVVSVRRYKVDGSYDKTINCYSSKSEWAMLDFVMWTEDMCPEELKTHLQTTPCNIMIRKNGKLISYKDL